MNQAAQVAQLVSGAIAIPEDLITGQYTIEPKEVANVLGTGKHVGCVACLRDLGYENRWEHEQVFVSKQVQALRPDEKLSVVERIVVRLPVDLGDVEIGR